MVSNNNRTAGVTAALTALLAFGLANAAVPEALSYQGYLTDRFGQPNNETLEMTLAIYNVPTGGAPLWSEQQSVPMFQGLFNLELGSAANPFPVGLFDTPLWLGLTVSSDSEMEPRRPLTTVGFAFKADDADSLQGQSAASLDQSDHVDDTENPHATTSGQIGAASEAALVVHVGDTANPHAVTAADAGAASSADLTLHVVATEPHHSRYTDTEAVASMGNPGDENPLNHGKYQDNDAVSAVLASDGEGSGLDADLVDGLEANEIIDAIATASQTGFVFAGFTTNTVTSDIGPRGVNAECKTDFGPTARVSTTREIIDSASTATLPGMAWVRPSEVRMACGGDSSPSAAKCMYLEASGQYLDDGSPNWWDCDQWTSGNSGTGLVVVGSTMAIDFVVCGSGPQHVACSVPVVP